MSNVLKESILPNELRFGLGWDVARGLLPKLDVDLDSFACLLKDGRFVDKRDLIYFSRIRHFSHSVKYHGDNNSGYGTGDDEMITVDLSAVPNSRSGIVFGCRIFRGKLRMQNFGKVKNPYVRIATSDGKQTLFETKLNCEEYKKYRGFIFGALVRNAEEWRFEPINTGYMSDDINHILEDFE